jgi:hypothetical protein
VVCFKVMCFESVVPTTFNISGFKVHTNIVNDFYDCVTSVEFMSNIFHPHSDLGAHSYVPHSVHMRTGGYDNLWFLT